MSYVEKVLQQGEQVRYQAALHWVTYLHGLPGCLRRSSFGSCSRRTGATGYVVHGVLLVLVAGGLFLLARAWFIGWITEIAVTNRRVIYKPGFISRTTAEMHMDKIESVKVDQSILGRILDYGKVTCAEPGRDWIGTIRADRCPARTAQSHHRRLALDPRRAPDRPPASRVAPSRPQIADTNYVARFALNSTRLHARHHDDRLRARWLIAFEILPRVFARRSSRPSVRRRAKKCARWRRAWNQRKPASISQLTAS